MSNKIAAVVPKLVSALEALENADERQRATQAALTVFGTVLGAFLTAIAARLPEILHALGWAA